MAVTTVRLDNPTLVPEPPKAAVWESSHTDYPPCRCGIVAGGISGAVREPVQHFDDLEATITNLIDPADEETN